MKSELALLLKALAFAAHKHRDQRRKDPEASPYINHPIALADVLVNEGGVTDVEVLCAALLHDTVEDTATTPDELAEAFGARVASIVAEVTDDTRLPKAERKRLQIEHAGALSTQAKLVKLADKICNLRDVAQRPPASWDLRAGASTSTGRSAWSTACAACMPGWKAPSMRRTACENSAMDVLLASPRGFCAGVERAIEIVERALELHGAPIYVRHEIVHNKYVVDDLRAKGAVFVEELDEVPTGATVIFSAHGVSQEVRADAARRGLKVFDATCPLVTKVHVEVAKMLRARYEVVMIGHRGHPEAEGTMGQAMRRHAPGRDGGRRRRAARRLAGAPRLRHADHAFGRRRARDRRRPEGALPHDPRPEEGRHLLRDAEPPGRGEDHGAAVRGGHRGRLAEQLELEPAA